MSLAFSFRDGIASLLCVLFMSICCVYAQSNPALIGFRYEHSYGLVQLEFDQLILASTVDLSKIYLMSSAINMNGTAVNPFSISSIFNDMSLQGNTTKPYFYVGKNDYARLINVHYPLGTSLSKTHIHLDAGAFKNHFRVPCLASHSFAALEYAPDTLNPYCVNWSLDMNLGYITMTFSEPVIGSGTSKLQFTLGSASIQSVYHLEYTKNNPNYVALIDNDEQILVSASSYNRVITISLGYTNLNRIKQGSVVGRSADTSWLSLTAPNIQDTSGNPLALIDIDFYNALAVTSFTPDTNKPYLMRWEYDIYYGTVTLQFSEVIKATSFNYSALALSSHHTSDVSRTTIFFNRRDYYRNLQTVDSNLFVVTLSVLLHDRMLDLTQLCTNKANSYLVVDSGIVWDTSPQQNRYFDANTTLIYARQASVVATDTVKPFIVSVTLNMTDRTILFGFHKNVRSSTLALAALTFQSELSGGGASEFLRLSSTLASVIVPAQDSPYAKVLLGVEAFTRIKSLRNLGRRIKNSFFSFSNNFIQDKAFVPNNVVAVPTGDAFAVTSYVPDRDSPYLVSWYANMNDDEIVLEFSEPIDPETLRVSFIRLYSDNNPDLQSTFSVSLSIARSSFELNVVTLYLADEEKNSIKSSAPLCLQRATCYLSHSASLGKDVKTYSDSGEAVSNSVLPTYVMMASEKFIDDKKGPKLNSYVLDMKLRLLILEFSEPVSIASTDTSAITMYNSDYAKGGANQVAISRASFASSGQGVFVSISLSSMDYVNIKKAGVAFNVTGYTYLSLARNFITDVAGNAANGSTQPYVKLNTGVNIKEPKSVIKDTVPAAITAIFMSSNKILSVYFDDIVQFSSVSLGFFNLYNPTSSAKFSLIKALLLTRNDSEVLTIDLRPIAADLLALNIAQTEGGTSLFISADRAYVDVPDMNPSFALSPSQAVNVGQQLSSFRLDFSNNELLLPLAMPILWGSWNPSRISIFSKSVMESFALTTRETVRFADKNTTLVIILHPETVSALTAKFVVTDKSSLLLVVERNAFVDTSSVGLGNAFALSCTQILIDAISPRVSSFDVDMDLGEIKVFFSKPITTYSITLAALTLIDSSTHVVYSINLQQALVITSSDVQTSIRINLNVGAYPTLRDQMHQSGCIGIIPSRTLLLIDKGFVADTNTPPRYMEAVSAINAIRVQSIVNDASPPRIVSWGIDMGARRLYITFDESVKHSSNDASYYLLLRDPANPLSAQQYLVTSKTAAAYGNTVTVEISATDINAINLQERQLCTSASSCYLSVKARSIEDMSPARNLCAGILFKFASMVSNYVTDTTPPVLVSYEFSLQTGDLWMHFDEIIDCYLVNLSFFVWQYAKYLGVARDYFSFSTSQPDCTAYTGQFTKDIHIVLDFQDLTGVKATTNLMKTLASTWVSSGAGAISDTFNNVNANIIDGYALNANTFYGDTVRPTLISYTITSAKIIILYFSEPMRVSILDTSKIKFQTSLPPYSKSYFISTASLYRTDANKMTVEVALNGEFARIAADSTIFNSQASTFMSIANSTITDTSGNSLIGIPESFAQPLGPSIIGWDLNVDTARIKLQFNERVSPIFDLAGVDVQSETTRSTSTVYVTLTSALPIVAVNGTEGTVLETTLNAFDINNLKFLQLVSQKATANLVVPFGRTSSLVSSTLIPLLRTVAVTSRSALKVRDLMRDVSSPALLSFAVNFNLGILTLLFDEPVRASTFVSTAISLLSSSGTSSAIITGSKSVNLVQVTTIQIALTRGDLNNLKIAHALGALDLMVVNYRAAEDYFGNFYLGNTELNAISVSGGVADSIAPVLVDASLDGNTGVLHLYFDEVIDISSLLPSFFTITNSSNGIGKSFALTKYTTLELLSDGSVSLDMKAFHVDWEEFIRVGGMGSSTSNTYIKYHSISDVFGNKMTGNAVLQASLVILDNSPLKLLGFRIEKPAPAYYRLELSFSKSVSLSKFNCSDIKLLTENKKISNLVSGVSFLNLVMGSSCSLMSTGLYSNVVNVSLPSTLFPGSGGSSSFEWIYVSVGAQSTDANGLITLSPANPIQIGSRVRDYFIDMNSGKITFSFVGSIPLANPFNCTDIGFYSSASKNQIFFWTSPDRLSPLFFDSPANDVLATFTLSLADLNRLKEIDVDRSTILLLIRDGAILDTLGYDLATVQVEDGLKPFKFFSDNIRPALLSTTLDLGSGLLRFFFNEPIRAASVRSEQIRIQSTGSSLANSFVLGSIGGATPQSSGNVLSLTLSKTDIESLTLRVGLAKNAANTFFSFPSGTAKDYAGNVLPLIAVTNARIVTTYIFDTVRPAIETYDLDMTSGVMTLWFSEAVRSASITPVGLTLMSRAHSILGVFFGLTGGTTSDNDGSRIRIQLTLEDIYSLKNTFGLVRNSASAFLLATDAVAVDMIGNSLVPVVDTRGMSVSRFTPDATPPTVTSIDIDVNAETITFHTSELTWIQYVDPRGVIFQNTRSSPTKTFTLTQASKVYNPSGLLFSSSVVISIAKSDLNTIKYRSPLLTSSANTWLAVKPALLVDVFGNPVASISTSSAQQVARLVVDVTPPILTLYEMDMNNGIINLVFDESINFASINASQLILQTHQHRAYGFYYALGDSRITSDTDARSTSVSLALSADTLAYLKAYGICKTVFTCYMSWTSSFLADQFGNFATPIWDAEVTGFFPILTNKVFDASGVHIGYRFTPDTFSPVLSKWLIDRTAGVVQLSFNEPIEVVDLSRINLFSSINMIFFQALGSLVQKYQYSRNQRTINAKLFDVVCSATVLQSCVPAAFNSILKGSLAGSFYLSMQLSTVTDLSEDKLANTVIAEGAAYLLRESTPLCNSCPAGQYVLTPCTSGTDRVCVPCTSCAPGMYTRESCSTNRDVTCELCSECRLGQYISTACTSSADTSCSVCRECKDDEFMTTVCELGVNAVCDTCKSCSLTSDYAKLICNAKGLYVSWYQANCCFDDDGVNVECKNVDLNNLKIAARNARHHWVFSDPTVDMTVYGIGQGY